MVAAAKLAEHIVRKRIAVSVVEEGDGALYIYGFFLLIRFCTIWGGCVYEKSRIDLFDGGISDGLIMWMQGFI